MWTLLSFTGRFDVAFLEESLARGEQWALLPGERTAEQKQKVRDAQIARTRFRRGAMLERLQESATIRLNPKQQAVLQEYQSGELRTQANRLTLISGHGRLKHEDLSFVDIGGSTGGFVRTVLDDWEPPDLWSFEV